MESSKDWNLMGKESSTYLAAKILNDGTLSGRKPGSVHATYLVIGTQASDNRASARIGIGQDGVEDVNMQSSPFMSSSLPPEIDPDERPTFKVVALVKEQDLEVIKARYQQISSVHIYSLGPTSIHSLQVLSDCNRELSEEYVKEDLLHSGKQYGTIQNGWVRRRIGQQSAFKVPFPTTIQSNKVASDRHQDPSRSRPTTAEASEEKSSHIKATSRVEPKPEVPPIYKTLEKKATSKLSGIKREQSDIFKSFSKPKPKLNREDNGSSVRESSVISSGHLQENRSTHDDEPMKDESEDEHVEDFIGEPKVSNEPAKSKSEREEDPRQVMDKGDEIMENTMDESDLPASESQGSALVGKTDLQQDLASGSQATIPGGRRRGRRKIMKKKTFKDAKGYIVTKEEPAWESFSEDEPVIQKDRQPASAASTTGKVKKVGGKPGQGNIRSFFGKN